jgi:O-antigen/teichoic acid export membrane protein
MAIKGMLPASLNRRWLFSGIFLTSMSGLVLEIAITRIFSAAIWYHFAFVAVSVALLGLGSSGLFVQFRQRQIKENWADNLTIFSAIGITAVTPIALFVMHILSSHSTYLPLFMGLFAVPFFFIGVIISAAFNAFATVAGRLYSADLIGASLGALLVILLLTVMGGEETTLAVGLIAAVAAVIFSSVSKSKKKIIISLAFVGFAASLLFVNASTQIFSIQTDPYVQKDLPIYLREHPGFHIVKTQWNSFSRIDVVEGGSGDEGLVAKIFIDGGAGTNNFLGWQPCK